MPPVASTLKPRPREPLDRRQHARLVLVAHRDEQRARARQVDAGAELALGEGQREIVVEAHDLAGRVHLRAEQDVDAGEAGEGEHRFLDRDVAGVASGRASAP